MRINENSLYYSNPFYYSLNPVGGSISSGTGVIQSFSKKGFNVDILTDDNLPTISPNESINYIYFKFTRKKISIFFTKYFQVVYIED